MLAQIPRLASILMAQCQFVPDRCCPRKKVPWRCVPWTSRSLDDASFRHNLGIILIQFESPTRSLSVGRCPEAGISKNYPGSPEVELRFCPWLILFKYWTRWPDRSSSLYVSIKCMVLWTSPTQLLVVFWTGPILRLVEFWAGPDTATVRQIFSPDRFQSYNLTPGWNANRGGDSFIQSLFLLSCFPATFYLTDHLLVYVFKVYFKCMLLPFLTIVFLIKKVAIFNRQSVDFLFTYARTAKFHLYKTVDGLQFWLLHSWLMMYLPLSRPQYSNSQRERERGGEGRGG